MNGWKNFTPKCVVAAILISISFTAQSAMIRVSQESAAGAGDFDTNVLGTISAFDSLLTAVDYYGYNTNFRSSFDDGDQDVTLTSNMSHTFFVDGADGLSAFFVHDKPDDGTGGMADMTIDLNGDTADVLVRDDPGDAGTGVTVSGGGTHFESDHNWIACCTDGFVIGALDNNWELLAGFDSRVWADFTGWLLVAGLDGAANIPLASDIGRRVRFDVVPIPSAVWLFGTALIGFIGFSRRRTIA